MNSQIVLRIAGFIKCKIVCFNKTYQLIFHKVKNSHKMVAKLFPHIQNNIVNLNKIYVLIIPYIKLFFLILLKILRSNLIRFLNLFQFFVTLTILITWFPNFNDRKHPWRITGDISKIYLGIFKNSFFIVSRYDLSPILAIFCIRTLIQICS